MHQAQAGSEHTVANWPALIIVLGGVLTVGWTCLLGYGLLCLVHVI
jgi:hypothetical protein